jgi:hypothetical protein
LGVVERAGSKLVVLVRERWGVVLSFLELVRTAVGGPNRSPLSFYRNRGPTLLSPIFLRSLIPDSSLNRGAQVFSGADCRRACANPSCVIINTTIWHILLFIDNNSLSLSSSTRQSDNFISILFGEDT